MPSPYRKLAGAYKKALLRLVDVWMDKSSSAAGHVYIGVILTEAYYSRHPWMSVQAIFKELGIYSTDTIRRRLEEMVDYGVVEFTEIDTKKVYRAVPKAAEATCKAYTALSEFNSKMRSESYSAPVN